MGATTVFHTFRVADKNRINAAFSEACEDARYEHGHGGYTGTIAEFNGIGKWKDLLLDSEDAAEDFIEENHDKWDPAMAVSFKAEDGSWGGWIVGGWVSE